MQVCVHARLQHGQRAELGELGGAGVVVEGAGDEHVEAGFGGFAGGVHQVWAGDGAELRGDEDAGAALAAGLLVAFRVAAFGADGIAGPRGERGEGDPVFLVRLLDAGGAQVVEDDGGEVALLAASHLIDGPRLGDAVRVQRSVWASKTRWGDRLSTVNGPATRTRFLSSKGRS